MAITLSSDHAIPGAPLSARLTAPQIWGIVMLAPYLLVFLAFVVYPVCYGLWLARHPASYVALYHDPIFARAAVIKRPAAGGACVGVMERAHDGRNVHAGNVEIESDGLKIDLLNLLRDARIYLRQQRAQGLDSLAARRFAHRTAHQKTQIRS